MKKLIKSIVITTVLFASCTQKESIPAGLILQDNTIEKDTNYIISSITAAQAKNVFIEEFTGVRCVNCPSASVIITNQQLQNPNRIYVAKVHYGNLAVPAKTNDPDFRTQKSEDLAAYLSSTSMPQAAIDRTLNTNQLYVFGKNEWIGKINSQISKTTPINLELSLLNYDAITQKVNIKIKETFITAYNDNINYHIYILENNIIATQDSNSGYIIDDYHHEEILRDIITPVGIGSPWLNNINPKQSGLVAEKVTSFILSNNVINVSNAKVLVALQNASSKEIIQVQEIKIQ